MGKQQTFLRLTLPLAVSLAIASPASAQTQPPAPAGQAVATDNDESGHVRLQHAPKVSKFEARRIRHACRERANERGVKGAEREAFLSRCFFGRRVTRKERRECAKLAAAQGIGDRTAQREFVNKCVREGRGPAKPGE
ncbi:MAG TPA: hypothetical protein VEH76_10315 [Methylocystis sp.]|nr:hypothetical protein [Methylocystis sp.]